MIACGRTYDLATSGLRYREAFETESDLAMCVSLTGRLIFKSHLHNGQRVATE